MAGTEKEESREMTETIRCLLCRGVVLFTETDQARYKDHLSLEHRVHYYVSWIIEKTLAVAAEEEEEVCQLSDSHPSLSITPLSNTDKSDTGEDRPNMSIYHLQNVQTELVEFDEESRFDNDDIVFGEMDNSEYTVYEKHNSYDFTEARILETRTVDGKRQFKCSVCPQLRPWPSLHKADRHQITHIPLAFRKMVQCPECKERFINEKNLQRHIDNNLCQGIKFHKCVKCNLTFDNRYDLQEHEEVHADLARNLKCPLCGAKFKARKYLQKHFRSHSNVKPFSCDICGKSFKSEYYVKTHKKSHFLELNHQSILPSTSYSSLTHCSPNQAPAIKYERKEDLGIEEEDEVECITDLSTYDDCEEIETPVENLSDQQGEQGLTSNLDMEVVHVEC